MNAPLGLWAALVKVKSTFTDDGYSQSVWWATRSDMKLQGLKEAFSCRGVM